MNTRPVFSTAAETYHRLRVSTEPHLSVLAIECVLEILAEFVERGVPFLAQLLDLVGLLLDGPLEALDGAAQFADLVERPVDLHSVGVGRLVGVDEILLDERRGRGVPEFMCRRSRLTDSSNYYYSGNFVMRYRNCTLSKEIRLFPELIEILAAAGAILEFYVFIIFNASFFDKTRPSKRELEREVETLCEEGDREGFYHFYITPDGDDQERSGFYEWDDGRGEYVNEHGHTQEGAPDLLLTVATYLGIATLYPHLSFSPRRDGLYISADTLSHRQYGKERQGPR